MEATGTIIWTLGTIDYAVMVGFLAYLLSKENRVKVNQLKKLEDLKKLKKAGIYVSRDKDWAIHYSEGHNNLRFDKTLQWNFTYYSVLLFGGIIGFYILLNGQIGIKSWMRITMAVISFLVFDFGIYLTTDLLFQMRKERIGLFRKNHSFWYSPGVTLVVWGTILVGFLSALLVILSIP